MRDLLVVVLHAHATGVRAWLAEVDRPGTALREASRRRSGPLADDARAVLADLEVTGLDDRLAALAVAVDANDTVPLQQALADEVPGGWPLPAALPVVVGRAAAWAEQGAPVADAPLVAGAVVAAARAVGAHAHLPR